MKLFDSFWKPAFYQSLQSNSLSFWKGFGRLVVVASCLGILYATALYISFGKTSVIYINSLTTKILNGYPNSLILTLHNGVFSKNSKGEIKLYPISDFITSQEKQSTSTLEYCIAINETKEATLASLTESNAFVFLGKDGIIAKSNNGIRMYPYAEVGKETKDVVVSKDILVKVKEMIDPYVPMLPFVFAVLIVIVYSLALPLGKLLTLLFTGFVVMVLSKHILKRNVNFSEAYIFSLYSLPSIMIIDTLVRYVPYISIIVSLIPFFTVLLTLLFLWYMFRDVKKKEIV